MKENKVEEFLRKVDRPWGMSMTELEQFQSEVKQLKSEQNKVAVEKLEELLKESSVEYHLCDSAGGKYKCSIYAVNDIFIKEQIRELKGESE